VIIFQTFLLAAMLVAAICAAAFRDLMNAVIACALVSLAASIMFYFLQAPDVAMAEASIGAGLTTGIFIFAIRRTARQEEDEESS
jgi:multicomponent Na+:H+ antiporter subunit A